MTNPRPKVGTLSHWFGCDRMIAKSIGSALEGCAFVGIPFCGGCSAVQYITARSIVCNDAHKHLINLAKIAADPKLGPELYRRLRRRMFHPDTLAEAQEYCREQEMDGAFGWAMNRFADPLDWATAYFITVWMARGGQAGTDGEFNQKLSFRWNANGGDSNTRFRSATQSFVAWRRILKRCNFTCMDAFDFLANIEDAEGNALYVDAPWPDDGDSYKHKFNDADQVRLADRLSSYSKTRVVIRFGVHPLITRLYPSSRWYWREQTSRAQSNGAVKESLICNLPHV